MTTTTIEHAYTPEQFTRAAELWRQLLDNHVVRLASDDYNLSVEPSGVDDEWLAALIMSDGAAVEVRSDKTYFSAVTVTLQSYSDGGGSCMDAANVHYWQETETPGVTASTGGTHGEGSAWTQLGELPTNGGDVATGLEWLAALVSMMDGLTDYPLISDESHSEYVDALTEEAWDSYLGSDVRSELETALGLDDTMSTLDIFNVTDNEVRDLYFGCEENEFRCESATSVVNDHHDDAVRHVADAIVTAWRTPAVDPRQLTLTN